MNPLDAKPLNEGEDERLEKILKSKEKFEPYYKKQLEKLKQQQKLIQDMKLHRLMPVEFHFKSLNINTKGKNYE